MIPKIVDVQRDFSAGEVNVDGKRSEDLPALKAGARTMRNFRILSSRKIQQRPGRRALFVQSGRVDEVRMDASHVFRLCFGADGHLRVRDSAGAQVFDQSGYSWVASTVDDIRWDVYQLKVYITFPGMRPQVLTWDGASTWTVADYAETVTAGSQKKTPFYRLSPQGVTMQPGAVTGTGVSVTFSSGMNLSASHVGTRMRFCGRQVQIASVTNATTGTIDIKEPLPPGQTVLFAVDPATVFNLGELVQGKISGAIGQVVAINSGAKTITVQLLSANVSQGIDTSQSGGGPVAVVGFSSGEAVIGAGGSLIVSTAAGSVTNTVPQAVTFWDDEVMNSFRGWPQSVSVDQNRLIFCDFPALPQGIAWSYLGVPTDLLIGANPSDGFFEIAPKKCRVYNVVNTYSAAGDELVFTSAGVFMIPISASNPLRPGSVQFLPLGIQAASSARPAVTPESVVFLNASGTSVVAVVGTGQQTRPYITRDISEWHSHLLASPKAIAITVGEGTFPERYIHVLNGDGSLAVGKYDSAKDFIGWVPWTSSGTPNWISALESNLLFTTDYTVNVVAERIDDTVYLDGSMLVNAAPAGLAPGGGQGPLWWIAGGSVVLMDGLTFKGTYAVDVDGNLVPNDPGEDLSSSTLLAGKSYEPVFEPFLPNQEGGASVKQRMRRRRISEAALSVQNSTGFKVEGIAPLRYFQRVAPYNVGESQDAAPPLREDSYTFRPTGRDYDPRLVFTKDVPGPIRIVEFGAEVTV
ncbi:MAG: hypothetical protein IT562_10870 [Alphaproteobacteria bacterium]|nr:hypothetical protein [Alphaproteobacteria bacterium]